MLVFNPAMMESRAPRIGHKKSRLGCAQCKRRHVKCNEETPCSNCIRHGVACSLAGGPNVVRDDTKKRLSPVTAASSSVNSRQGSHTDSEVILGPEHRGSSPLRRLTQALDRGHDGIANKRWLADLELMHHFDLHPLEILTEPAIAQSWHTNLPRIVFTTPYVMHIVLGCSALHLAYSDPQRARALQISAVDHLDKALQEFRQDDLRPNADNADARFCFSWFVVLFAYATPSPVTPIDAICEMFRLVQGIDATVKESFTWLVAGPLASLLNHSLHETMQLTAGNGVIIPQGMTLGLDHLDYMMALPTITTDESEVCSRVLNELKQLYANVLAASQSTGIGLVMCWPKSDATPYIHLLRKRQPQALVILSYYCVILDLLDDRWFLQGWSTRLMQDIVTNLDEAWKSWIAWPMQTIIMKSSSGVPFTSTASDSSTRLY